MKRLLLILAIGASALMADATSNDDLLNVATAGKTTGTQFEMNKEDMQKADGGYYFNPSYIRVNGSSVYSKTQYQMPYIRVYGQPVYYYN